MHVWESLDEYFGYQQASKRQKKSGVSVFGAFADIEKFCGQCGREAHMHVFWDEFKRRDYAVVGPKFRPQECLEKSEDNSPFFITLRYMSSLTGMTLPGCVFRL